MIKNLFQKRAIRGFDDWSTRYAEQAEKMIQKRGYSYDILTRIIADYLTTLSEPIILELGTGPGILGKRMKKITQGMLIGTDISSGMLSLSEESTAYDLLVRGDAQELPFMAESIDCVYSAFMFHSLPFPDKALREIKRVLKYNGKAVIIDLFRREHRIPGISMLSDNFHSIKYEHGALSRYYTPSEFHSLLLSMGFIIDESIQLGHERNHNHYAYMIHF